MQDITLGTIYEDVAELQEQVTLLQQEMVQAQQQIAALQPNVLAENTDLNTLGVGKYIIPSTVVCATLLNKPTTSNATGFITVEQGGVMGQLVMQYVPCAAPASYYQRAYFSNTWNAWNEVNLFDSGWADLALDNGVVAFNDEQKPRYRRVGKEVFITGVVKNISANETNIATLPANYRPSKKIIIAVPSTGARFSRVSVLTTGAINYEQISDGAPIASQWHSIACSFNVD